MNLPGTIVILLASILTISSDWSCSTGRSFSWQDKRDGSVYLYETAENLDWMTRNFNYLDKTVYCKGAWVFSYDERDYEDALLKIRKSNSGVLYDFETAKRIAAEGWRLPSESEWRDILPEENGGNPGVLGDYNLILDGRARTYNRFSIYSGVTFWTSDRVERNEDNPKALVVIISFSEEGMIEYRFEEQSTDHAYYVRYVKDNRGSVKNTQY